MYLLKQIVAAAAQPLTIALLLAVLALVLGLLRRRRLMLWTIALAGTIAYVGSITPVAGLLLRPLEASFAPLRDSDVPAAIKYIVVLGSGYSPSEGYSVTAALDREGLVRVIEGIRLQRLVSTARLVVSGGAPPGRAAPAAGYALLARSLGVDPAALIVLDDALDTDDEARELVELIGAEPFLLVTSAYHMPRAVREMQRAGARPIAAPAGQLVLPTSKATMRRWLPSSSGAFGTERAVHEYLGLMASRMEDE
jgi:uncharacterized SAM-binding protein YcdF (DUF218 family)